MDVNLRYAQGSHAFIEEMCSIWPACDEVFESTPAHAQIRGDTPDLLVIKSAQFFLSQPPIAYSSK